MQFIHRRSLGTVLAAIAFGLSIGTANAADGINRLVMVTQMKTANANDDALQGAEQQRDLIKKKQQLRSNQKSLESQDRMGNFEIQNLMSQYNQSQKQQSDVQKKRDQTSNGIAQNIK